MADEHHVLQCRACGAVNRIPPERIGETARCGKCHAPIVASDAPLHVTSRSFDREVLAWPGRALAEFEDGRCYYCQQISPFIGQLAKRLAGRVKVVKVDIQAEPGLASRFGISATPTFILFSGGSQVARIDGAPKEEAQLEAWALQGR